MRTELSAATIFYVDPVYGSDTTGDGSMALPWATLGKATKWTQANLDLRGNALTIQLAAGSYGATWISGSWVGQNSPDQVVIQGDLATPSNCLMQGGSVSCIDAAYGARFTLCGFKLSSTGRGGIYSHEGSWVTYHHIEFGYCPNGPHAEASKCGATFDLGDILISGGATAHLYASDTGECFTTTGTTTLIGIPYFSGAFAWASYGGNVTSHTKLFSGAAVGKRFLGILGGTIGSEHVYTFPGSIDGETDALSIFLTSDGASQGSYPDGRAQAGADTYFVSNPTPPSGSFAGATGSGYWRRHLKDQNLVTFSYSMAIGSGQMGSATLWANVALPFCPKRSTCVPFTAGLQSQMFQGIITAGSQNMSIQRGDGSFGMFEGMRLTGGGTIEVL